MRIKYIEDEDTVNYGRTISMFIGMPYCDFKCEKENPECHCQNSELARAETKEMSNSDIIKMFDSSILDGAVVFGGMEPILSIDEVIEFLEEFRVKHDNLVIIYTGYTKEEIPEQLERLKKFKNIIMKFGRFIPGQEKHWDDWLGVYLASDNQYAEKIS